MQERLDSLFSPWGEGARRADEGAGEAGLSSGGSDRVGVISATVPNVTAGPDGLGNAGRGVPFRPLIRLPAPSPRGEKRYAALSDVAHSRSLN
ncbi:UNVERIFIED_ORG: hypothetical protein GGD58_004886 [Rhizobium pisi]